MEMNTEISLLDKVIMDAKAGLLAHELTNNDVPLRVVSKLIRQALVKLYGRKNVKVRKEDYGWIDIEVRIERPHEDKCIKPDGYYSHYYDECERCRYVRDATRDEVWRIINSSGLGKHLYTYYDDMGERREQCIVTVLFHDEP
jgi:hypothetical protein